MRKKRDIYTIIENGHPVTISGDDRDAFLMADLSDEKRAEAMDILRNWFEASTKTSLRHTSYGMKHWLEDAVGCYVSNNQFKDAMLSLGFEPSDYSELNWCFKVKPTKALKKYLEDGGRWW